MSRQAIGKHIETTAIMIRFERPYGDGWSGRNIPRDLHGRLRQGYHVAAPGNGPNEFAAGLAKRATNFGDALGERIFGDRQAWPIGSQEFVLRDDPPRVRRQMPQHVERLMAHIDARTGAVAQFLLPQIKGQVGDLDPLQARADRWVRRLLDGCSRPARSLQWISCAAVRLHPADPACKAIPRRRRSRFQNNFGPLQPDFRTAAGGCLEIRRASIGSGASGAGRDRPENADQSGSL